MIALGVARLALFAAVGLVFGIGLFGAHHRRLLAALAVVAFMANLGWFAVLTAQMFEVPLVALSVDPLVTALSMPAIGPAFGVRALLLLVLIVASRWRWPALSPLSKPARRRPGTIVRQRAESSNRRRS